MSCGVGFEHIRVLTSTAADDVRQAGSPGRRGGGCQSIRSVACNSISQPGPERAGTLGSRFPDRRQQYEDVAEAELKGSQGAYETVVVSAGSNKLDRRW